MVLVVLPGSSSTTLEALLLERYAGIKTKTALKRLAQRVQPLQGGDGLVTLQNGAPGAKGTLEAIDAKLDLLDSLKFGLGYSVLQRYPVEFLDESAFELWSVMAAVLFTTGFSPESIGKLFKKHPCLFASAVRSPENIRTLFEWMREQGIVEKDALRVVNRYPLVLQADVRACLEPRLAYVCAELQVPREEVARAIVRHPELLSVDSSWLQKRISYYREDMGLAQEDLQVLLRSQPSAFAVDVDRYLVPMTAIMRDFFDFDGCSHCIVKSGLLSRSVDTVQARIRCWIDLGLSKDDLRVALRRFPRLLCYPVADAKYQEKLAFLSTELGVDIASAIRAFPALVSYSLERRLKPRVLAIKALTGKTPALQQLAMTESAFIKKHKVDPTAYAAFVNRMNEV